jgi:hypothetical protein
MKDLPSTQKDRAAASGNLLKTYQVLREIENAPELLLKKARRENTALPTRDISDQKQSYFPDLPHEEQEYADSEEEESTKGGKMQREEPPSDILSPEEVEELAKKQDLKNLRQKLKEIIEKKIEMEIADLENKLRQETDQLEDKVLAQYSSEVKEEFFERVKEAGEKGLQKGDIMQIFDVKTSRANDLQHQLAADYEFLEYEQAGSQPGLTRHKRYVFIDFLARKTGESKEELEEYDTETLKENYESIKDKQERGKKGKNPSFL